MSCPTKIEIKSIAGYLEDKKIVSTNDNKRIENLYNESLILDHAEKEAVSILHTWTEKTEGFEMSRELYKKFKVWVDKGCNTTTPDSSALEKLREENTTLKGLIKKYMDFYSEKDAYWMSHVMDQFEDSMRFVKFNTTTRRYELL